MSRAQRSRSPKPVPRSRRLRGAVSTRGVAADVLLFALVAALASIHAWTRIEGTMAGYALSAAQVEHSELLREQKALRLELATQKSSRRIEADAKKRLGLVKPSPDRIVQLPSPVEP